MASIVRQLQIQRAVKLEHHHGCPSGLPQTFEASANTKLAMVQVEPNLLLTLKYASRCGGTLSCEALVRARAVAGCNDRAAAAPGLHA